MRSPHAYATRLHPKSWDELELAREHYTKFLIVRDPLERLISCYKDKMVTNTHWSLATFRKQVKAQARRIKEARRSRRGVRGGRVRRTKREAVITDNALKFWDSSISAAPGSPKPTVGGVATPKALHVHPRPEDIPSLEDFLE